MDFPFFLKAASANKNENAGIIKILNTALPATVPTPIENCGVFKTSTAIIAVENSGKLEGIAYRSAPFTLAGIFKCWPITCATSSSLLLNHQMITDATAIMVIGKSIIILLKVSVRREI